MKVLIIGGTGTLSSHIVSECIERGHEVTMINRGMRNSFINEKAELIKCDLNDEGSLKNIINGRVFDCCIDFLVFDEKQLLRSLHFFAEAGNVKQYIFISSAQVYNTSIKELFNEDSSELVQPLWSYSVNKVKCERLLCDYCKSSGINYTIIRPGVTYGETRIPYGMDPIRGKHWTMIERIKSGKPIITWNNGENKLNLTHVDDFARGAVGLIGNNAAYNEAFNVVGDFVYSWGEVLNTIGKIIGMYVRKVDIPVDFYASQLSEYVAGRLRGGRAQDLCCSNEKLKKAVPDFTTTISLETGLRRTLDYYKKNEYCDGFDYVWDAECDRIIALYNSVNKTRADHILYIKYHDGNKNENIQNRLDYLIEFYREHHIMVKIIKKMRNLIRKVL